MTAFPFLIRCDLPQRDGQDFGAPLGRRQVPGDFEIQRWIQRKRRARCARELGGDSIDELLDRAGDDLHRNRQILRQSATLDSASRTDGSQLWLEARSQRFVKDIHEVLLSEAKNVLHGLIFAVHGTAEGTGIVSIQAETQTRSVGECNGMFTQVRHCSGAKIACRAEFQVDARHRLSGKQRSRDRVDRENRC